MVGILQILGILALGAIAVFFLGVFIQRDMSKDAEKRRESEKRKKHSKGSHW